MFNKKYIIIFFLIIFLFLVLFIFLKYFKNNLDEKNTSFDNTKESENIIYNSNVIKDVKYVSKDNNGNEYIINADQGEIDFSDKNIIYLKNIKSSIKLSNSENITIFSKFGKYNILNYDTIFNKNVHITYKDIEIYGDYLDFSIENNLMIISKNVTLINPANILKADVVEMSIKNRDTKIYMYEKNKKVIIKSKN